MCAACSRRTAGLFSLKRSPLPTYLLTFAALAATTGAATASAARNIKNRHVGLLPSMLTSVSPHDNRAAERARRVRARGRARWVL